MSRIKNKDTSIELKVRKWLFAQGFRFRKNVKKLPGHPDVVLKKYNTVIFIHGCFWHRHENCKDATVPKTRVEFWTDKFQRNIDNDKKAVDELERLGWNVIVAWQCEIERSFEETMSRMESNLLANICDYGWK
jgi:DNA mismatch endonuclease (patch repair protein)